MTVLTSRAFVVGIIVIIAGAAIQWLRDGLGIIDSVEAISELADSVEGARLAGWVAAGAAAFQAARFFTSSSVTTYPSQPRRTASNSTRMENGSLSTCVQPCCSSFDRR